MSSTKIGAFISLSQAAVSRGQSSWVSFPERTRLDSTFASLHMSRCVTSAFDISSVKSATGVWMPHAEVRGDAERERRLPHRRARGEDHEVARLEAPT